ncbi:MAG: MFS transporter [Thermomicrobiales bacterium]
MARSQSQNVAAGPRQPRLAGTVSVPQPGLAFALLGVVQAALTGAIAIVLLALPAIQGDLGLSRADLVLVTAAPGLSFSGLLLLGGRLADLFGRRRVFVIGLVIFGLAAALAGLAPSASVLLAARFAQGCGAALAAPAAMALLGFVYADPVTRGRAVAVWGSLSPLGASVGTLLSGVIVTWASWRWAFAIPLLVAVVAVLAAPRILPSGPPPAPLRLDVPGAVLVTAGLTLLSFGFVQIGEYHWLSTTVLIPLVGGALLLMAFIAVESRVPAPLVPLSFFASRQRRAALLIVLLAGAVSATLFFFLALYFLQVQGWSPLRTSAAFLPFGLVLLVIGGLTGRLIAGFGPRLVTAAGLIVAAVGLFLLNRLEVDSPYAGTLLVGLLIFQIGAGLAFGSATVAAVAGVPDDEAGLAGGVVNAAQQIGPTVGLAILVSIATAHTSGLTSTGFALPTATTAGYAHALGVAGIACVIAAGSAVLTLRSA